MLGHKERKNLMNSICRNYKRAKIIRNLSTTEFHSIYNVIPNLETCKIEHFFARAKKEVTYID